MIHGVFAGLKIIFNLIIEQTDSEQYFQTNKIIVITLQGLFRDVYDYMIIE